MAKRRFIPRPAFWSLLVAATLIVACDRLPKQVPVSEFTVDKNLSKPQHWEGFSRYPVIIGTKEGICMIGFADGYHQPNVDLRIMRKTRANSQWVTESVALPRSLVREYVVEFIFEAGVMSDGEVVFRFVENGDPSLITIVDKRTGTVRELHAPRPYWSYLGMTTSGDKIFAVLLPLEHEWGRLSERHKPARTMLLEMTTSGKIIRSTTIDVLHPIAHLDHETDGWLPMAVAGNDLFLVENPGKVNLLSEKQRFDFGAQLQVIDTNTLQLRRTINLPGMDKGVYGYCLFSNGTDLYVKENSGGLDSLYKYDSPTGTLRCVATVMSLTSEGPAYSFCVLNGHVYCVANEKLEEVGRIENVPAK
jgi:hypothetical protein